MNQNIRINCYLLFSLSIGRSLNHQLVVPRTFPKILRRQKLWICVVCKLSDIWQSHISTQITSFIIILFKYVNQGPDPADRSTWLEGYNMYRNDSNSSKLAIFMKYWCCRWMKLNKSQNKSSDIETKVIISLVYASLNQQQIPWKNLE